MRLAKLKNNINKLVKFLCTQTLWTPCTGLFAWGYIYILLSHPNQKLSPCFLRIILDLMRLSVAYGSREYCYKIHIKF